MSQPYPFTVDIRPADSPPFGKGRSQRPKAGTVSFRFEDNRRVVTIRNTSGVALFNVEVRERHRAMEWLSMRRPSVPPGITTVRLGQEVDVWENVYLLFEYPKGTAYMVTSDGRLVEAEEQ